MPAVSKKQQRFMGAELARMRAGKKTQTGMSESQLEDYAATPTKRLPERVRESDGTFVHSGRTTRTGSQRRARRMRG